MTEIELKAWIDDPESISRVLDGFARPEGAYDKLDEYWRPAADPDRLGSGVRLRSAAGGANNAVVNFKRKEVRGAIEVNDEREFAVSDAAVCRELFERLGLEPWIRKRKTGRAWTWEGITAEISRVEGLGDFVELEILADGDAPETVAAARARLLALLARLGVPESALEPRYYTAMLSEKRRR